MALKKSELYSTLWASCDELRGGMDASQYKDYVLVLLFMKYVSDRYAGDPAALIEVPKGGGFADMVRLKGSAEIGDRINKIVAKLADANESLKGAINVADFNDEDKLGKGKEMVDRLSKLVAIFEGLDFGRNRVGGDDLLGDAYEYLMRHFATESGKSKGQFYTPAEVSRVMAQVIGLGRAASPKQSIYDPTCGSGSLLLKAHDEALTRTGHDLALYGQEMDNATAALARMNMVLHDCPTAEIHRDNTLSSPFWKEKDGRLKVFDFVVANFPFSNKSWLSGVDPLRDPYGRFEYGVPPAKNGDYAFLLHILKSMKASGKGAVVHPHGVLFRGNAEADIRRRLVQEGVIQGIIGLPANLFYGTGIPACILVLDKEGAASRKGIFMIDASKGFIKDGNKNRLREQDIHKIVDTFTRQIERPKYSRLVPRKEIEDNGFNLNLPRYIDSSEPEDLQDIEAHLKGGIPLRDVEALAPYWEVLPGLRTALFATTRRKAYLRLAVNAADIRQTILEHEEFLAYRRTAQGLFKKWKKAQSEHLAALRKGFPPRTMIHELSESLLSAFRAARLIDPYDVYQELLDYWTATMQDDAWQLSQEGWQSLIEGKPNRDLIPESLIIDSYFSKDKEAIEILEAEGEELARRIEELAEEEGGDEGLLAECRNEKDRITAKSVKERRRLLAADDAVEPADKAEELAILDKYLSLSDAESAAGKKVKEARKALDAKVLALYPKLKPDEIKSLVIEHKWMAALSSALEGELDRVSQTLAARVKELAERYEAPLPELAAKVEELEEKVKGHLKKMGFEI